MHPRMNQSNKFWWFVAISVLISILIISAIGISFWYRLQPNEKELLIRIFKDYFGYIFAICFLILAGFGFALDEDMLPSFEQVKVGGVVSGFAFVFVLDDQRLLLEPFHFCVVVQEVNEIAFEQRLERDHSPHLDGRESSNDIPSTVGNFSDWHFDLLLNLAKNQNSGGYCT